MTKSEFLDRVNGLICDLYYGGEFLSSTENDAVSEKLNEILDIIQ